MVVGEEREGMASLWALLTAPDARSCFQWLTRLAHGLGTQDQRGMDARRADLLVALLTGTLTWAPAEPADADTDADADAADDGSDSDSDSDGADTAADDDTAADPADTGNDTGGQSGNAGAATDTRSAGAGHTTGSAAAAGQAGAAGGVTGAGPMPPRPVNPGKPLVQLLMPFTTLLGLDQQPCELAGHGPIPAELAREIAADPTLKRLVYDPLSGTMLDYGRTTYRPPAGLADHVRARDVHCRAPICRRRVLDGHLDHIEPFPDGPTNDTNLEGCCGLHHQAKHAPGWNVRALPDGRIQWVTPTGHRYHSRPHDYRPEPDLPPPASVGPDDQPDEPEPGGPEHPAPRRWTQQDYDRVLTRRRDDPIREDADGTPPF